MAFTLSSPDHISNVTIVAAARVEVLLSNLRLRFDADDHDEHKKATLRTTLGSNAKMWVDYTLLWAYVLQLTTFCSIENLRRPDIRTVVRR